MVWDAEVDVLCVGAGIGALATAVAVADAGAEILVVTAGAGLSGDVNPSQDERTGWLPHVGEAETDEFLAAVVDGFALGDGVGDGASGAVPTRIAAPKPVGGRTVETFAGSRVAGWGAECAQSVTAALFSTVRGWTVTEMRDADGRSILVAPVGEVTATAGCSSHDLHTALVSAVAERDIEVAAHHPLQRLVFEGGAIVGAVLGAPDDEWAVGTRQGVVLAPDSVPVPMTDISATGSSGEYQVSLVTIPGSRFARVELIGSPD